MIGKTKILVVDDDPVNRDFFMLMLSKLGFTVEEAFDGVDAQEKLQKFHPNLILLDNVMPRMTGFEFTKSIKEDPVFREIPIIMFSALDDVHNKLAGFELGVDDYITKPFNFSEVLARINAALRSRQLFDQIVVRESRLNLAEALSRDMKQNLADFAGTIDELDSVAALFSSNGSPESAAGSDGAAKANLAGTVREKTGKIRKQIAELDAQIEKTILEWEALKKNEIGLSALENQIKKFLRQE